MNDYYGGGWSAQKIRVYFWLLLVAMLVTAMLHRAGIIDIEKPKSAQQVERERQTGQWDH
ncbi:hypothetical protein [uncultured Hymenobacter sp.]|uniref:hypothetical protein n=1 Tax=uncultured Hymenobacter sp. TaxID=170016 RepID=UPI0035CC2AE2